MSKRRALGTILGDCFGQARLADQDCPECHGRGWTSKHVTAGAILENKCTRCNGECIVCHGTRRMPGSQTGWQTRCSHCQGAGEAISPQMLSK